MTKKNCSVESRKEPGIMRHFHNKKNERDRVPNIFLGGGSNGQMSTLINLSK